MVTTPSTFMPTVLAVSHRVVQKHLMVPVNSCNTFELYLFSPVVTGRFACWVIWCLPIEVCSLKLAATAFRAPLGHVGPW